MSGGKGKGAEGTSSADEKQPHTPEKREEEEKEGAEQADKREKESPQRRKFFPGESDDNIEQALARDRAQVEAAAGGEKGVEEEASPAGQSQDSRRPASSPTATTTASPQSKARARAVTRAPSPPQPQPQP